MYHGRKRPVEVKLPSPEEVKKQEEQGLKITNLLNEFLEIRHGKREVSDPLDICNVMVQLCPEIPYVYNFRRELLIKQIEKIPPKNSLELIGKEIMMTLGLLKSRPKCYSIWSHRQWLVIKAHEIEENIIAKTGQEIPREKRAVVNDLAICNKMLQMDERNFHAWNYRIWLVRDVLKYNKEIVGQELEYLKKKIEDNFSNFSAFHFKGKLLTEQHQNTLNENIDEQTVLFYMLKETFEEELEIVKNAIFIQPHEQGIWQQYKWLISLQVPFQIIKTSIVNQQNDLVTLRLVSSDKISSFRDNIKVCNEGVEIINLKQDQSNSNYCYSWLLDLKINQSVQNFTLQIVPNSQLNQGQQLCKEEIVQKHNLMDSKFEVNLQNNEVTAVLKSDLNQKLIENIDELIAQELEFQNELLESEQSNTFVKYHQIFMNKTQIGLQILQIDYQETSSIFDDKIVPLVQNNLEVIDKLSELSQKQKHYLAAQKNKWELTLNLFQQKKNFDWEKLTNQTLEIQFLSPYKSLVQ